MNAVGIDVSKGKSIVCVMRPFGEVVLEPFKVLHTAQNLHDLAEKLKALDRETRVVLEATGNYHKPVAFVLHDAGLFVSVVNPVLIHRSPRPRSGTSLRCREAWAAYACRA